MPVSISQSHVVTVFSCHLLLHDPEGVLGSFLLPLLSMVPGTTAAGVCVEPSGQSWLQHNRTTMPAVCSQHGPIYTAAQGIPLPRLDWTGEGGHHGWPEVLFLFISW